MPQCFFKFKINRCNENGRVVTCPKVFRTLKMDFFICNTIGNGLHGISSLELYANEEVKGHPFNVYLEICTKYYFRS